ncbi:MAG: hypothetical protein HGA85_09030, partial [Nanoarchaeota archaeon]|nr:hypothetical protein [Nanoarchaeota archaeon]
MIRPELLEYIQKVKAMGYDDKKIEETLLAKGYPKAMIEEAEKELMPKPEVKKAIPVKAGKELIQKLKERKSSIILYTGIIAGFLVF